MNEFLVRIRFWGERPRSRGKVFPIAIDRQGLEILEHQLAIVRFQQMFSLLRPHAGPTLAPLRFWEENQVATCVCYLWPRNTPPPCSFYQNETRGMRMLNLKEGTLMKKWICIICYVYYLFAYPSVSLPWRIFSPSNRDFFRAKNIARIMRIISH